MCMLHLKRHSLKEGGKFSVLALAPVSDAAPLGAGCRLRAPHDSLASESSNGAP